MLFLPLIRAVPALLSLLGTCKKECRCLKDKISLYEIPCAGQLEKVAFLYVKVNLISKRIPL